MQIRSYAIAAGRLVVCLAISAILAVLVFKLAELKSSFSTLVLLAWWKTGQYFAIPLSYIVPQQWIFGDPKSDTYWPAAGAAGFTVLSCVFTWGLIMFAIWSFVAHYLRRSR